MTYKKQSSNVGNEDVTFTMILSWLAATATAIATVVGIVSFA